jgi:hypothetical protein
VPKQKRERPSDGSEVIHASTAVDADAPLPLRQILTYPVITSVANHASLTFLSIMLNALLPLVFAMPIEIGGLGFDPPTIGYFLGLQGVGAGVFNALYFVRIVRRFGVKWTFFGGISLFLPMFVLMPIMNLSARTWGVGKLVWTLLFVELLLMILRNIAFGRFFFGCQYRDIYNAASVLGCIFMCITASAPNKRSLGATNGLSQMAVSISRAIGPAFSTSLFSFSVQHNILGGYGVYLLLVILVALALVLANFLPTHFPGDGDAET